MATATPLRHPREQKQLKRMYPHSAQFKATGRNGKQDKVVLTSPCAYEPYQSRNEEPGDFQVEAPTGDQVLLPTWQREIEPKQLLVLTFADGTVRRFTVLDALPQGVGPTQTLVLVTPKQS